MRIKRLIVGIIKYFSIECCLCRLGLPGILVSILGLAGIMTNRSGGYIYATYRHIFHIYITVHARISPIDN